MRICFALPNAWFGGIRTFALNLGRYFRKDGHDVGAVIAARGVAEDALGDLSELQETMDVRVCVQKRVLVRSRFLHRVIQAIEAGRPEVVVLSDTLWAQAALPYLNPSLRRIVVVHSAVKEQIELASANSAYWDALVAVGPGVHDHLVGLWGRQRARLIPVGVAEPRSSPGHDFREPILKICWVGRVSEPQKNVFLIPAIARGLVGRGIQFRWAIIGDGPDLGALKAQIADAGLLGFFDFTGACRGADVQRNLGCQHILVLPSNYESIGHVLLEAQMLGVVPVASRLPGATDFVITHGRDGLLCEPGDSAGFINALAFLSDDRGALESLSLAAQRGVRERFEISRIAAQYYDLFGSISRANSQLRRKSSILGYYPIPRDLLPSRVRTAVRLGRGLVLDRVGETGAGRESIGS